MALQEKMDVGITVAGVGATLGIVGGLGTIAYFGNGGELADHNIPYEASSETANDVDAQAKAVQAKALAMLEAEGIKATSETYPTTGTQVVILNTNAFVGQGTYLPLEYSDQPEYQGVMALKPYGVPSMANWDKDNKNCLIVDGDPKTDPLVKGC